jgi:hypothetical protein
MTEMYIALNISNSRLQVVALKGKRVRKWASLSLPEGVVRDGLILKPQALGEAIDRLFKAKKIPRDKVIASLSGLSFTYRFLSLPRMKPELTDEAVRRAAKKEISLPLEELYVSWQQLPGGEEAEFFVLGVPRHLVDALATTLAAANLTPYLLDLRPLALARAAGYGDAIVVNMDADSFDIAIVAGGIPRVIHTINPRSKDATQEDNVRRLADELTKTTAFYQGSHPAGQLGPETPLLLTGELAAEPAVTGLLQTEVDYPVASLVPPVEVPPEMPLPTYAASIGLALKKTPLKTAGATFHDININILTGKYRQAKKPPRSPLAIVLGILLAVAVVGLYPLYQARSNLIEENAASRTELYNINREINVATLAAAGAAGTEETIGEITAAAAARQEANNAILAPRGSFSADLTLVTDILPSPATFTSVAIESELITVRGEADSVFTVVAYADALEASGAFSGVRIARLDEAPPETGGITFEVSITR